MTVRFEGRELFEFSCHHYTPHDLWQCIHTCDVPHREETWICLDHRQRGLGTGSCGPQTMPKYWVNPGHYEFAFRISIMPGH
ncbi:MAG: hypothetical protein D6820_06690 [Lentisphaerae bacterium]|nr:MAG: hypothetical protein D6820_06690 [Lentisphaerota bacterium]